ncbi:MAG: choice-of-anchor V domain-containing protein [Woeseiaceae bacterium]|nr:choice-of-anchor V domain-containing protein [Woeseiaceae bacterium]
MSLVIAGAAFMMSAALAFPDGAPWGAANPATEQHCASCHFGSDAVYQSPALRIEGMPSTISAGKSYPLTIVFDDPQMATAGFQLIVHAVNGQGGRLSSTDPNTEFLGAAIRSIATQKSGPGAYWNVEWQAPPEWQSAIRFYLAATAANDDGSPFGDTVHYRSYQLTVEPAN